MIAKVHPSDIIELSSLEFIMKLLILIPVIALAACSSVAPPQTAQPSKINPNLEVKEMDRTEVIQAARECINSHMKPYIQSVPQKTDHGTILIPVAVNCEVYGPTLANQ